MTKSINKYCKQIRDYCKSLSHEVRIMEVCGTHTMAIAQTGLRSLLPETLKLISGPGCPVCVTGEEYVDQAVYLAGSCGAVVATYGDMVRVPGSSTSLAGARSTGAAVEVVYSADQAVELAKRTPDRQVVFLAVGFETTAPGTAMAVRKARRDGVENFSVLTAHKCIPPAMRALLNGGDVRVDGFLCPGHVSVILGWEAYEPIVRDFARPCVVGGFDAVQVLAAVAEILRQLDEGAPQSCSVYPSVSREGNPTALKLLADTFVPAEAYWRGLGVIPESALVLREEFADFDAAERFDLPRFESRSPAGCRCGDVICGRCSPADCEMFATRCTPRDPVGPCMVSSEGTCAAAYKFGRPKVSE